MQKLQRYCAYQDRCHREVRSKLIELGIYGDALEEIMAELIREDFLNEERFARSFARGKFNLKQWGRLRIRRELKMRDVSDYCIRKAMEEIDETEYLRTIKGLLAKKANVMTETDAFKKNQKLVQYAMRRGFEPELIWATLGEADL